MNRITVLSEDTANKIAAGEIVEGPLSVVKELVENAIDAQSTTIHIELKSGGKSLIRISDNGSGMSADDAVLALERHATSKIAGAHDLEAISTMGFRGEAVPSIASVSRFSISTCEQGADAGTFVKVDGGKLINVVQIGRSPGTAIEVKNLFYNVPARRKYMRSVERETAAILKTVQNYAVVYPQIRFTVVHNDRTVLLTPAANTIEDRIAAIFGNDFLHQLIKIDPPNGPFGISGFVSRPVFTRSNRSAQMLFVNNRPVRNLALSYAIAAGYRTLLPKGKYPVALLFLTFDPTKIDVNVHPTKSEIRFKNEWQVKDHISRIVSATLRNETLTPEIATLPETPAAPVTPEPEPTQPPAPFQVALKKATERTFTFHPQEHKPRTHSTPERASVVPKPEPTVACSDEPAAVPSKPRQNLQLTYLAQLKNSYLLTQDKDGLVIIDQHAAHERVLYEKFSAAVYGSRVVESQRLLVAATLELSPAESILLDQALPLLKKMGFDLRPFGKNTFIIDAVPAYLIHASCNDTVTNIIAYLQENSAEYKNDREPAIMRSACRAAIMAHDVLTEVECQQLIRDLGLCDNPYTCPHGRPTMVSMSLTKLEKEFKRT